MISQFADIFVQMVVLFAVGATGYAAKRLNLMDEDFDKKFSKLILNTALPALILASVLTAETLPSATKILWTAGVSCASYVVLVAIGFSITAALRVPDGRKGVFRFMMVFGNTGFIGFPVTAAVFGAEALIYTTVFNLAFNALVFTLGVWMLATDNKYGVKIKMSPKSFLSPCIMAAALVRLLVAPALVWLPLHFLVSDPVLLGVIVLLSAMPVATNGTMLCYQYGGDSKTMAQGTFVTTLGAVFTIPLLAVLFMA